MRGLDSPAFRAAIAGMFAMAIAMGVGRFVYTPLLPLMIADGAFDAAGAGWVAGANYLGYLVGALAASLSFFAPARRYLAYAGLIASVATTAALALEPGITGMSIIRFASGVASAFAMIFTTTIVLRRLAQERRPRLVSLHFAGVGLGITLSAIMVSVMAAQGIRWPGIWLGTGGLAVLLLLLVRLSLPGPMAGTGVGETEKESGRPFGARLWIYIAGYGFFGFGYVISATFINAMARSEPVLQPLEPWVWVVVGLSILPSVWAWYKVADTVGIGWAYALACLVEAFGVGLPAIVITPAALVISAMTLGGTFVAVTALGLTNARNMAPESPARVLALMTAAFGLGQMVGPVVAGILFERTGELIIASQFAAAALLLAAVLSVVVEWQVPGSSPSSQSSG